MNVVAVRRSRAVLAVEVARLRADGLLHREIAEAFGISRSYACELTNDATGVKARARKASYRGTCRNCGAPTTGCDGPLAAPELCIACSRIAQHEAQYWTAERVLNAIRRFAALHGRPPTSREWTRVDRANGYPVFSSVYANSASPNAPFPKWADAIEAAGFPRPASGHYERTGERGLGHPGRIVLAHLRAQTDPAIPTRLIAPEIETRQNVSSALQSLKRRGLARQVRRSYWTSA